MRRAAALLAVLCLTGAARAAPTSDAQRLVTGLPPGFGRPVVVVLPLLDQRPLAATEQQGATAVGPPPPRAWRVFVSELSGRANLRVLDEDAARERMQADALYRLGLQGARNLAYLGQGAHREVRLKEAADTLGRAVQAFRDVGHHLLDPREVARAQLTRGLALLEQGESGPAYEAFQEALALDPSLRLRPGFDRQETIDVFENAREALLTFGPPPPAGFVHRRRLPGLAPEAILVRGRVVPGRDGEPDRLEVSYRVGGGLQEDVQPLGPEPGSDGSRLAGRVYACLPFGEAPRAPRPRRHLYVDAGFTWFTFTQAPVELFGNFGAGLSLSWLIAPQITLDGRFSLTNSSRDREEDLRADIATLRAALGAGYNATWRRLRFFATVGFEAASPGEVVVTRVAACKYFDPETVPPEVCDPSADVDRVERAVHIGATIGGGVGLRLVDDLFLTLRADAAEYFYGTADSGLGRPVGAQLGLGWRFF